MHPGINLLHLHTVNADFSVMAEFILSFRGNHAQKYLNCYIH